MERVHHYLPIEAAADPSDFRRVHVPWCPSPVAALPDLLRLLRLRPDDCLLDVGCGDGELLLRAAALTGCSALGLDIQPALIGRARLRAAERGLQGRCRFEQADCFAHGWSLPAEATAVYLYLTDDALAALMPALVTALAQRRGMRVLANQFEPDFLGRPIRAASGMRSHEFHLRLYERPHSA